MKKLNRIKRAQFNPLTAFLIAVIFVQSLVLIYLLANQKKQKSFKTEAKYTKAAPLKKIPLEKKSVAKVAIVIDDWGYSTKNLVLLDGIHKPLTLSILPFQPNSKTIALYAKARNWQVILHLPLEPRETKEYARLEPNTILTTMKKDEVIEILGRDIDSLGDIVGVSNHMGSKATVNEKLMRIVFQELHKRNLFFLDSLVTTKSVCKKVASDFKIGFVSRDVFLDNESDYNYISGQLDKLISLAKRKGKAIGIGHDRKLTLEVLADRLTAFDSNKEGVDFALVSELID
ncbi:MAG: divergent polysaccharide deacetylase family protein [Candidatus Omnitrophota bacterium]